MFPKLTWLNGNKGLVEQVESVQRKAARFICADWRRKSSPTQMIEELKLQSLEYRRYLAKIKLMHAFVHGHKFISDDKLPERTRYDANKFKPIYRSIQAFTSSYIPSTVPAWNKLPSNVIKISCPDLFNLNFDWWYAIAIYMSSLTFGYLFLNYYNQFYLNHQSNYSIY